MNDELPKGYYGLNDSALVIEQEYTQPLSFFAPEQHIDLNGSTVVFVPKEELRKLWP